MANEFFDGRWIPVSEIREALDAGLLSQDEARLVVYTQIPVLHRRNELTAPPLEPKAAP